MCTSRLRLPRVVSTNYRDTVHEGYEPGPIQFTPYLSMIVRVDSNGFLFCSWIWYKSIFIILPT